jgi:hypothetical protein
MIRHRYFLLWLAVVLLLIYWAVRLFAISAFPPFLDEGIHVSFGRDILTMGPLAHANEGRQFAMWLYILFGAQANEPFFIARVANLIILVPGFAAFIGTGRLFSNHWGAFLAALLLLTSPYHHFFERLALADAPAASAVMLAIYFAARLSKRVSYLDAMLCGVALFIACGMKLSILPYFAVPMIACIAFTPNRQHIQWAGVALFTVSILTGGYFAVVTWRGYDPFALLETSSLSRVQVFLNNAAQFPNTIIGYFGIPLTILLLIGFVVLIIERRFFLPLCLSLPLFVLLLSPRQTSRHLIPVMTLLLLCGAVTLGDLLKQRPGLRLPAVTLITFGTLILWLPFAWNVIRSPLNLMMPADDYAEYIYSEASGFGLAEVLLVLNQHRPARVIGVLANCVSLRELASFPVECPRVNPNGEDIQMLSQLLATSRVANTYAVLEKLVFTPASAPGTAIAIINVRQPHLTVYALAP